MMLAGLSRKSTERVEEDPQFAGPRDKLLSAAIGLFSKHGFEGVSTGAVAKQAGLTQSMVHYHFGSKAKLWESAIDSLMRKRGEIFPIGRLDLKDLSALDRLKFMVRRFINVNVAEPNLSRILIHEGLSSTDRLQWVAKTYMIEGYRYFDSVISDAMEAGSVRRLPVENVTHLIIASCVLTHSLSQLVKSVNGTDVYDVAFVDSFSDTVIEVLFRGLERQNIKTPDADALSRRGISR